MNSHLENLRNKHFQLEKTITEENLRPRPDLQLIKELKQKKLRLKEEMQLLMQHYTASAQAC